MNEDLKEVPFIAFPEVKTGEEKTGAHTVMCKLTSLFYLVCCMSHF